MLVPEEPFFMTNPDWYCYNEKEGRLELTDKAPKEAIESYIDHYLNCVHNGIMELLDQGYINENDYV